MARHLVRYCDIADEFTATEREIAMETVFDANNNLEARLVLHQLQNAGLYAEIVGEHLQGALGELPAFGNVRVVTRAQDANEARKVIAEWEAS